MLDSVFNLTIATQLKLPMLKRQQWTPRELTFFVTDIVCNFFACVKASPAFHPKYPPYALLPHNQAWTGQLRHPTSPSCLG